MTKCFLTVRNLCVYVVLLMMFLEMKCDDQLRGYLKKMVTEDLSSEQVKDLKDRNIVSLDTKLEDTQKNAEKLIKSLTENFDNFSIDNPDSKSELIYYGIQVLNHRYNYIIYRVVKD